MTTALHCLLVLGLALQTTQSARARTQRRENAPSSHLHWGPWGSLAYGGILGSAIRSRASNLVDGRHTGFVLDALGFKSWLYHFLACGLGQVS